MARSALAQENICALRREIAKIEGRPVERLVMAQEDDTIVVRHAGIPEEGLLAIGVAPLDRLLGGGLPVAALTEIHGSIMHGAGVAGGFTLALLGLLRKALLPKERQPSLPVLWIAAEDALAEAGLPYAPGLARYAGLLPHDLLISRVPTLTDALWIAEEAAGLRHLCAVVVEMHGNPARLDLTATRRLHRRAQAAGRPVLLLRQSAEPWPTAAPVRLLVGPHASASRLTLAGPLDGSIGRPAFLVTVSKCRAGLPGQFILEWNPDEHSFEQSPPQDSRSVVSIPGVRPRVPPAAGAVVAFRSPDPKPAAAHLQPSGGQRPPHRRPQHAG